MDNVNWVEPTTVKTYSTEEVAAKCKTSKDKIVEMRKKGSFDGFLGKSLNDFVGDLELINERYEERKSD